MTKQIGDLKLHFSRRGIAFKWKDGDIKRLSFGGSGGEAGDGNNQEGYQDDARFGDASYAAESYGQDGYAQGEDGYYANQGYDAEREQSGSYEDSQLGFDDRFDFLYHNDILMYAALVLFPPLGIWILWKRNKFDFPIRAAITGAAAVWFIAMLIWLFTRLFAGGGADPTTAGINAGQQQTGAQSGYTDTVDDPTRFNAGGDVDLTVDSTDTTNLGTPTNPTGSTPSGNTGTSGSSGNTGAAGATAEDPDVYATATGTYYHQTDSCSVIPAGTAATKIKQSAAIAKKLQKCPTCWTGDGSGSGGGSGSAADNTTKVWATGTGKYYHTLQNCSGMKNAANITLAKAKADGKKACPVCTASYYYNAGGKYYHIKNNCSGLTNAKKVTLAQAKATGKPACPVCITKKGAPAKTSTAKKTTKAATTYYATKQGAYYHTKSTCSGMKGATKITLAAAQKDGKKACPVCVAKTTATGGATYYSTVGGKYYHVKSNCGGMKGATKVTLATAKKRGQSACPTCITQAKAAKGSDSKAIYYGTTAGKYYHTKANCSGMTGAKKITLATALKYGKKPCPVCFKKKTTADNNKNTTGTNKNTYVYATQNGKYYHSKSGCGGMTGAARITLAKAKKDGKKACPKCMKRTYYYSSSANRYYHKTASCPGVRNATRITLASAKAKGKIACPVCILKKAKSGDLKIGTYIVKGGKYYHKKKTCNGMKGAKKVSLAYAKGSGRTACPRCVLKKKPKETAKMRADKKVTSYLLKKGTYYHSTKKCSMLSGKKNIVKTSVYTAKTHKFKACPECVGKKLKTYVYVKPTGLYYHRRANCGGMKNAMKLTLQTAINRAYKRCTKCNAPKS